MSSSGKYSDFMTFSVSWTVHRRESSMMAQCAILVDSNRSTEFAGSVRNVIIMTSALSAITLISITCGIAFIASRKLNRLLKVFSFHSGNDSHSISKKASRNYAAFNLACSAEL